MRELFDSGVDSVQFTLKPQLGIVAYRSLRGQQILYMCHLVVALEFILPPLLA